ncbi:MAG: adenylate kinase [Bordetella sp.]|nr:MAG: adenylate kinase [Bordetella sp.]
MRLILLGPPGAGKGTQATFIAEYFKIPKISTGDMLRNSLNNGDPFNLKSTMNSGKLIPDEVIINIVSHRLNSSDCINGYLLDGFPRTIPQAEALKNNLIKLDYVIELDVPDKNIIERMSGRRLHPSSGRIYHVCFNPPKIENVDDFTGESLIQRDDDSEETIRKRLLTYYKNTQPLIEYYSSLSKLNPYLAPKFFKVLGTGSIEKVKNRLLNIIKI